MTLQVEPLGNRAHGDTDDGNPIKSGGVAMTTLPTKVADGKRSNIRTDATGRTLMVPYQVRELVSTAYATIANGGSTDNNSTEITLLAGIASTFLDLVYISCVNTSSATVRIDIRDATAGGIVKTMQIPANDTRSETLTNPLPQNTTAAAWTVQANQAGFSTTTVLVNAQFVQNL